MMESLIDTLRKSYHLDSFPVYQRKNCLSASTFGRECDRCVRLCKEGVFQSGRRDKRPDFSKCEKCGVCAACCPYGAISPIDTQTRNFLMALARQSEVSVGCEEDVEAWSVSLPCLAALSWEQIACAALKNGVVLSLRACGDCPNAECAAAVTKTIRQAREFLGDAVFNERVTLLKQGDSYVPHGKAVSRRELFSFFKNLPLDAARSMLPELPEGSNAALFYRALLRDIVKEQYDLAQKEQRARYILSFPAVTDGCTGCGICVRMCPEKALQLRGGSGEKSVAIDAWKCTGCGFCEKACREQAIKGLAKMAVPHMGTVRIKRLKTEGSA